MSGRNKKTLHEQLVICQRRLDGHCYKQDSKGNDTDVKRNDNSNPDRYFRLLMRQANLESQIFDTERSKRPKRASSRKQESSSSDS